MYNVPYFLLNNKSFLYIFSYTDAGFSKISYCMKPNVFILSLKKITNIFSNFGFLKLYVIMIIEYIYLIVLNN